MISKPKHQILFVDPVIINGRLRQRSCQVRKLRLQFGCIRICFVPSCCVLDVLGMSNPCDGRKEWGKDSGTYLYFVAFFFFCVAATVIISNTNSCIELSISVWINLFRRCTDTTKKRARLRYCLDWGRGKEFAHENIQEDLFLILKHSKVFLKNQVKKL